jgi:hypothetical protein
MKWEVELAGDKADLTELCKCLTNDEPHIEERKGRFFLQSSSFNNLNTRKEVRSIGSEILMLLTGSTRLALGGKTPFTIGSVHGTGEDGVCTTFLQFVDTVVVRDFVSVEIHEANGSAKTFHPAQDVPKWIKLGFSDKKVAKALRLFGASKHDWVSLYRLYEVIEEDVQTDDEIVKRGWATRASIKRFKHTANSPSSTGDASRHGKESTSPPGDPMTLPEAKALIELILHSWLRSRTTEA